MAKRRIHTLVLLAVLTTGVTDASADICRNLQASFHKAATAAANPVETGRYVAAIAQQNLELRRVRKDQRRLRCLNSSIIQVRPDGGSDCGDLATAITRMEDNLSILSTKLRELRGPSTKEQLIDELVANDCSLDGIETDEQAARKPYLDTVSGGHRVEGGDRFTTLPTGNVRTLCVRKCDGGFFPISSQSSPMHFERDAALCQQMCPGVETELFYQSARQAEAADMISTASGQAYRDLPTAFAYRSRGREESCTCDFAGYHERARANSTPTHVQPVTQSSIVHATSPATAEPVATEPTVAPVERDLDEAAMTARKVGPVFLPADKGTIDLRNPARPGPQPQQE